MPDTILASSDIETFVTELEMNLKSPVNNGRIILLVEGNDDVKAYNKLFNLNIIDLQPANSCHRMTDVMTFISRHQQIRNSIIAIKDADFDNLTSKSYPDCPNMFLTDTHDIETMMMTVQCCRNISAETISRDEPDLITYVASSIESFSYLKYYNTVKIVGKGLPGLRFKGIKIGENLYNGKDKLSIKDARDVIGNCPDNCTKKVMPTEEELKQFIATHSTSDYMNLTNGHDLVDGIVKRIHTLDHSKSKKYGKTQIEQIIRTSYTFNDFKKTRLYSDIDSWAQSRKINPWAT